MKAMLRFLNGDRREIELEEWRVVEAPRPSGPTQPEEERDNVQVKLRLPPTEAKRLDRLAREWGLTRSEAVVRMMRGQL